MPSLKLIHLANHFSTNIGNGALIQGAERVLREDLGDDIHLAAEPWDEYTYSKGSKKFNADFVDLVNASDGLLVNGAVTLNGVSKYKNAGMRFDLPFELWDRISKPIVFYGLSYRFWNGQTYHHLDRLKEAMAYILASPRILFGVRNDGTKEWLETLLGFRSERIIAIPDPALYVPTREDAWHPELDAKKINVILSLNNEDDASRFPGDAPPARWRTLPVIRQLRPPRGETGPERKNRFLANLARGLEAFSKDHELNVILCIHSHEDYAITGEFINQCPPRFQTQMVVSRGQMKLCQTDYFYDLYAQADMALSMRVHSMSPAVGLGTPMAALTSQTRMTDFMTDAGLAEFCLNIFDPDLADKLHARLVHLHAHADQVRWQLQEARSRLRERTRAFNERVAGLLQQRTGADRLRVAA